MRAEDYTVGKALIGSFRTPSRRELASTAPYGPNGALRTLEEWLDHYAYVTSSPPDNMLGTLDPALAPVEISPQERQELIDFLLSLSSGYASAWTQPPTGKCYNTLFVIAADGRIVGKHRKTGRTNAGAEQILHFHTHAADGTPVFVFYRDRHEDSNPDEGSARGETPL